MLSSEELILHVSLSEGFLVSGKRIDVESSQWASLPGIMVVCKMFTLLNINAQIMALIGRYLFLY